jgi:hypothetical protein
MAHVFVPFELAARSALTNGLYALRHVSGPRSADWGPIIVLDIDWSRTRLQGQWEVVNPGLGPIAPALQLRKGA